MGARAILDAMETPLTYPAAAHPKVDARVMLVLLLGYSVALFCARSLAGLAVAALALAVTARRSKVPVAFLLRGGAFAYLIVAFLFLYNAATAGWSVAVMVAARLLLLVWASLLLMNRATPEEMAEALRRLLAPLEKLGLPMRDFSTSLSIALRFMPMLAEELACVRAAQMSRGAAFASGSLSCRLRAYGGLMVPLFVGLFRRADRLALAMDARCFGAPGNSTNLKPSSFTLRDGGALFLGLVVCIGFALL